MYKALIVDDEPIVGIMLKSLINWEEFGIDAVYEAGNGKQALALLEKQPDIDIVLTDISMPVMDGLQLIEEIKRREWTPEIVVLSAYEDYKLVRSAFKFGVIDYILKTDIDAPKVRELMTNVIGRLQEKGGEAKAKKDSQAAFKERLLKKLLLSEWEEGFAADMRRLKLSGGRFLVCCLLIDDYTDVQARYNRHEMELFVQSVFSAIMQVLEKTGAGEAVSLAPDQYALALAFDSGDDAQIRAKTVQLLQTIKTSLSQYMNIGVTIGVSETRESCEALHPLYQQAEENAGLRLAMGKQQIIFPEDAVRLAQERGNSHTGYAMQRAVAFIKENYKDENMSVWMVSHYLGLSENHFSTQFRKEIGKNFLHYLTELRMEEAKRLMQTTNLKIYEICECVGYNNVEHFSRLFKKVTGQSPNAFRNPH